jgi:hypothetical protein
MRRIRISAQRARSTATIPPCDGAGPAEELGYDVACPLDHSFPACGGPTAPGYIADTYGGSRR